VKKLQRIENIFCGRRAELGNGRLTQAGRIARMHPLGPSAQWSERLNPEIAENAVEMKRFTPSLTFGRPVPTVVTNPAKPVQSTQHPP
jgi:hypothetical protein